MKSPWKCLRMEGEKHAPGSDRMENIALSGATITLVEPGRVKKPK
jgi:hypothetical protein